jgi:hypothetical protein
MTRIIIELEPGDVQSVGSRPGPSVASGVPQSHAEVTVGSTPPASVLAQAATLGAINGGPGPSSLSGVGSSAPIASSMAGATSAESHQAHSAGAGPQHG